MKTNRTGIPTEGFDLKLRIVLAVFAIVLPGMFLMAFVHISNMRQALEEVLEGRGDLIVSNLDALIGRTEALDDPAAMETAISRPFIARHGVSNIRVFALREAGRLTLVATPDHSTKAVPDTYDLQAVLEDRAIHRSYFRGTDRVLDIAAPLHKGKEIVGSVRVEISLVDAERIASSAYLQAIVSAIVVILITITVLWTYIRREINSPVERLVEAMGQARSGNLEALVEINTHDEFGWLGKNFNQMLKRIREANRENTVLMERIGKFNEELREKIKVATQELARKNEELRRANEDLFRAQRRVGDMERLASLGQFATQMAHELGTPLNSISGHIQILAADEGLDGAVRGRLKIVETQIDRLTRIIQEALNTMRFHVPKLEPVSVNAILERLIAFTSPGISVRQVELIPRLSPACPACPADPAQVEQVFLNLITNALDAMPSGGTLTIETFPALGDAPLPPMPAAAAAGADGTAPAAVPPIAVTAAARAAAPAAAPAPAPAPSADAPTPLPRIPVRVSRLPTPVRTTLSDLATAVGGRPATVATLPAPPPAALPTAGTAVAPVAVGPALAPASAPALAPALSPALSPAPARIVAPAPATPPGAPATPAAPGPRPRPDGVLVRFRDTGVGISREDLKRIFEPFFSTKGIGKGTGLGLSICQQIIKAHDGSIQVESEPGKGSVFSVRLRLDTTDPQVG